jgi:hypothetical protein
MLPTVPKLPGLCFVLGALLLTENQHHHRLKWLVLKNNNKNTTIVLYIDVHVIFKIRETKREHFGASFLKLKFIFYMTLYGMKQWKEIITLMFISKLFCTKYECCAMSLQLSWYILFKQEVSIIVNRRCYSSTCFFSTVCGIDSGERVNL